MNLEFLTRIFWQVAAYLLLLPFSLAYSCAGFGEGTDLGHSCLGCYETCHNNSVKAVIPGCVWKCMGLSKSRPRRNACPTVCETGFFCDPDMNSCTDCAVYCEKHDIQKTSAQCLKFCPDVYWASTTTTTTGPPEDVSINVIAGVSCSAVLLIIFILLIYCFRKKLFKCIDTEDVNKTSLPCSQDLEEAASTSKTPLTGPPPGAMGPVKQDQNPHTMRQGNLGEERGFPEILIPYTQLDGPPGHQTSRKQLFNSSSSQPLARN